MPDAYFQNLLHCLDLESEAAVAESMQVLQASGGHGRERTGSSLTDLAIRDEAAGFGGRVTVTLGKRDRRLKLPWTRLQSGSPVLLSEQSSRASTGWRGVVTSRENDCIAVVLAESPEATSERPLYRLDLATDEIARQRQKEALRRAEKADRGRLATLRQRLRGEVPPEFEETVNWTPLSLLDDSQRSAVGHCLAARDFAVIHGPPGTGKTTTVVEVIRQAVRRGERVLACAPSNLAVDNLFERLLALGEPVIRIGHPARVLPQLRDHTLDLLVESHPDLELARQWTKEAWGLRRQAGKFTRTAPAPGMRRDLREEANRLLKDARQLEHRLVEYLLDSARIVCCTLTGINDEILGDRHFELAVIDEAAQSTEPPCWIPIGRCQRLVLAGDHCQLPPTILSAEAKRQGFHQSLMEKLVRQHGDICSRRLTTQYRMHQQIMQFSSESFYEGQLVAAPAVREHLLQDLSHVNMDPSTSVSIQFFDTAGSHCEERAGDEGSLENPGEAEFVAGQVEQLTQAGVRANEIAVITPYAAQARRIRQLIPDEQVEVDTVDGFQGREKEAVVISLVRSNPRGEIGFLSDTRRTNVALTRARRKLIVFGDSATLGSHEFYLRLLEYFERQSAYGTVWELPQPDA